jgi:hypothetical protein
MMQVQTGAATRLKTVQHVRLAATGLGIEVACEQNLNQLVDAAGAQLDGQWAAVEVVEQAATNLERLIDAMAEEARSQGATTLHEWSLSKALGRLCPLFPFC